MARQTYKTNKKSSRKQLLALTGIFITVLAIGGVALLVKNHRTNTVTTPVRTINYSPPTKEEQAAGDAQKQADKTRDQIDNNPVASTDAEVVVVDAGQYEKVVEVRGYIANVYEDGGTCTATFTKGAKVVAKSTSAFKDATTTQCGAIDLLSSQVTPGTWQYTLSYKSPAYSGITDSKSIEVQ